MKTQYPGLFFVLEGLDGAGTTTQVQRLQRRIERMGFRVVVTHEPGDGPVARWIRLALRRRITFPQKALALLFLADRLDHLYGPGGIWGALQDPLTVVLSDRYYLSTLAYQSVAAPDMTLTWLYDIHHEAVRPTATFFLDIEPEECIRRIASTRGFHYELFEARLANLKEVRTAYLRAIRFLQREHRENIVLVQGTGIPEVGIERRLWRYIKPFLAGDPQNVEAVQKAHPLAAQLLRIFEDLGLQIIKAKREPQDEAANVKQITVAAVPPGAPEDKVVVNLYFRRGNPSRLVFGGVLDETKDPNGSRMPEFRKAVQALLPHRGDLPLFTNVNPKGG